MTDPVLPAWGIRMGQELRHGHSAATLRCDAVVQGQRVVPASGTVSIYAPGATTATSGPTSVTVDGTTKECSVVVDVSDTGTWYLGEGYRAEWTLVVGATTQPVRQTSFDIVRMPLVDFPPFSIDEMRAIAPRYDALLSNASQLTKAIEHIRLAWEETLQWVRSQGRRPSLVNDPASFSSILRNAAMAKAALSARREAGDVWDRDYDVFQEGWTLALAQFRPVYSDADQATGVDLPAMAQPRIQWGSSARRRGLSWVPT